MVDQIIALTALGLIGAMLVALWVNGFFRKESD